MKNREIKFRAWDMQEKYYRFPNLFTRALPTKWENFYLMEQFTGLKDNNGNEVYEGDIIGSLGFRNFRIEFFDGMFCAFNIIEESNQENAYRIDWLIKTYDSEVIGNIHENPELLNT